MSYKPDKYHQTDPPCELKSAVMGRQNSRKKKEAKEEAKPENGSLSGAATCSMTSEIGKPMTQEQIKSAFDEAVKDGDVYDARHYALLMEPDSQKLEECPFCKIPEGYEGSIPRLTFLGNVTDHKGEMFILGYAVRCDYCGAQGPNAGRPEDAKDYWNDWCI